jgi:hypothetical protein
MSIESLPKFSPAADKLWKTLTAEVRNTLLTNVWCGKCRHATTIKSFSGTVKAGDVLLVGSCSECHRDVARLIEMKGRGGNFPQS